MVRVVLYMELLCAYASCYPYFWYPCRTGSCYGRFPLDTDVGVDPFTACVLTINISCNSSISSNLNGSNDF